MKVGPAWYHFGMPENDNPCKGCENNCCKSFKLFKSGEEVAGLTENYPFLKVVKTDVGLFGNRERVYRVLECDRLQEDGSCEGYPDNRPPFCEKTGVEDRPAANCKLHDLVKKKNG